MAGRLAEQGGCAVAQPGLVAGRVADFERQLAGAFAQQHEACRGAEITLRRQPVSVVRAGKSNAARHQLVVLIYLRRGGRGEGRQPRIERRVFGGVGAGGS